MKSLALALLGMALPVSHLAACNASEHGAQPPGDAAAAEAATGADDSSATESGAVAADAGDAADATDAAPLACWTDAGMGTVCPITAAEYCASHPTSFPCGWTWQSIVSSCFSYGGTRASFISCGDGGVLGISYPDSEAAYVWDPATGQPWAAFGYQACSGEGPCGAYCALGPPCLVEGSLCGDAGVPVCLDAGADASAHDAAARDGAVDAGGQ